jgi:hypothetical protein
MPTWPVSLPQSFPLDSEEDGSGNILRTDMSVGPAKSRRRATAEVTRYTLPPKRWILTDDQRDTLLDFFNDDCGAGNVAFTWTDPWPGAGAKSFRFTARPKFKCILPGTNRKHETTMPLEELP